MVRRLALIIFPVLLAACGEGEIIGPGDTGCSPDETLHLGECRRACPCLADEACMDGLCYGRDCGGLICDVTEVCIGSACVYVGCTATGCAVGHCDPRGLVCVECLEDSHCLVPGTGCDPTAHACLCAPTSSSESNCGDGLDDDCDMATDCADSDCGDGTSCGPNGAECQGGQCRCPSPDASELNCSNSADDDCDGAFDCDDSDCSDGTSCGPNSRQCSGGFCVCPGGAGSETACANSGDDDCDGEIDCADADCDGLLCGANGQTCSGTSCVCPTGAVVETACSGGTDDDCDGDIDCADADCDGVGCGTNGRQCGGDICACPGGSSTELLCDDGGDDDCDGATDCFDNDCALDPLCIPSTQDTDGDGLPDAWEIFAGDASYLDWQTADTDGNGTNDGDEDFDGDLLSNLEELALRRLTEVPAGTGPHPLRLDLLVELDSMENRAIAEPSLARVVGAFAALPFANLDGTTGVGLHIYPDETGITTMIFDGSFSQRHAFFRGHPPAFGDTQSPPIPYARFVHAVVAAERTDIPLRAGEAVGSTPGDIDSTGVFVYYDAIDDSMPQCGNPPSIPEITLAEALADTFTHELGHTLQIGHDTTAGGAVNYFNTMSLPTTCTEAQERFHGWGNTDATLGNTESASAPRFSDAAAALMNFGYILSVDTGEIADTDM